MTTITDTAEVAPTATAVEVAAAEAMLRDMAYVLKLARRVKAEMAAAEPVPEQAILAKAWDRALVA